MAILPDQERVQCWADFQRENTITLGALTKTQLKAAVDAIDQWCEDNASSFNVAIPQPARNVLTAKQKARLLMYVVSKRHEVT